MNCKNCEKIIDGNFCSHCGQNTKVARINLSSFLNELSEGIFQINKGFFYSVKELFLRPGHSIREYLKGKRKNHFKPIAYAFTLSTIYFLLSQFVGSETFMNDFVTGFALGASGTEIENNQLAVLNWFAKHYGYTMLLLLPLYSLASYLAFLGSKFNYLEHFVLNAYILGQQAIFYSFASILSLIIDSEDFLVLVTLYISMFYTFFVFWQFFSEQSRVSLILRSLLTYVLYLIVLLPVFVIIMITAL